MLFEKDVNRVKQVTNAYLLDEILSSPPGEVEISFGRSTLKLSSLDAEVISLFYNAILSMKNKTLLKYDDPLIELWVVLVDGDEKLDELGVAVVSERVAIALSGLPDDPHRDKYMRLISWLISLERRYYCDDEFSKEVSDMIGRFSDLSKRAMEEGLDMKFEIREIEDGYHDS